MASKICSRGVAEDKVFNDMLALMHKRKTSISSTNRADYSVEAAANAALAKNSGATMRSPGRQVVYQLLKGSGR